MHGKRFFLASSKNSATIQTNLLEVKKMGGEIAGRHRSNATIYLIPSFG